MESTWKLEILFTDRVGIVANVATIMAEQGVNILSMEVVVEQEKTAIYLETEAAPEFDREALLRTFRTLPNLTEIVVIATLPQEKREKRFQVVLDSISDGILAVDEQGQVTTINRVAEQMLNCAAAQVVDRNLRELNLPDTGILAALDGRTCLNRKRNLITQKGRFQFLATSKLIRDSRDRVVGAVEIMRDLQEVRELASAVSEAPQITFSDMIGRSPAIQAAIAFAQKIAPGDALVSIRGESGTGKELFASAIHTESGRSGPFVPINCAALPEALLESELFGYVGGAFTGARREGKPGLFEIAREGTLFLDEIGEMPLALQAKMLRVLQERKVRRVGGSAEVPVDTRVVTATNKSLERLVEEKAFREDLYYRINVFPIHIPPLRERLEDIPPLVEHFLFRINSRLHKNVRTLSPAALEKLRTHRWPGNVRELRNVIERAAILCSSEQIGESSILFNFELDRALPEVSAGAMGAPEGLSALLDRYEKRLLAQALEEGGSIRQVARRLGVSHTTLLNKMKKHSLAAESK